MASTHGIGVLALPRPVYPWQPTPSSQLGSPDAKRRLATDCLPRAQIQRAYAWDGAAPCGSVTIGQKLVKTCQGNHYVKIVDVLHVLNDASTANLAEINITLSQPHRHGRPPSVPPCLPFCPHAISHALCRALATPCAWVISKLELRDLNLRGPTVYVYVHCTHRRTVCDMMQYANMGNYINV